MKIDKGTIDKVLMMNDEQLWKALQYVAKKSGHANLLDSKKPEDMSKIRQTLSSLSNEDIEKAINKLKNGEKHGK